MSKNIFVIGVGRSGTSLLQSMIASHPLIVSLTETSFLRRYVFKYGVKTLASNKIINEIINDEKIKRLDIDPLILKDYQGFSLLDLYTDLISKREKKQSYCYFLDKDPKLIEHIDQLFLTFDNSRVVLIYRDPRAIIASRIKAAWSSKYPFFVHLSIVYAQLKIIRSSQNYDYLFKIKYENLVTNPNKTLQNLCFHLNLSFSNEMLNYKHSAKALTSDDELQWKSETFKDLNSNNIDKWMDDLSSMQIFLIENLFSDFMSSHNYLSSNPKLKSNLNVFFIISICKFISSLYIIKHGLINVYKKFVQR